MCKVKGGIILKNRVFVPEYDRHSDMLKELNINDNFLDRRLFLADTIFVKVELSPDDGDVFSDIGTWKLKVLQRDVPDWYDEAIYKPQVVEEVKKWAKGHIYIGVDNLKINSGTNYYIKDCKNVEISGDAIIESVCGNTVIKKVSGNAIIKNVSDGVKINEACGHSVLKNIRGYVQVKNISENASVICACGNAVINCASGNSILKTVCGNSVINCVSGNTVVKNVLDNVVIEHANDSAVIISLSPKWKGKSNLILSGNAVFKNFV